jgi:hypothetical protein
MICSSACIWPFPAPTSEPMGAPSKKWFLLGGIFMKFKEASPLRPEPGIVRLYTSDNKALVENLPRIPTPVNMKQRRLKALIYNILRLLSKFFWRSRHAAAPDREPCNSARILIILLTIAKLMFFFKDIPQLFDQIASITLIMKFLEVGKVKDSGSLRWISSHLNETTAVKHLKHCPLIRRVD